ncbi:GntR family transcriptional regulator [Pseudomonas syringae]|uniref:GntR family transcriptional regulator n=1 Tax=Pseudomonas syringae TaxID=317 RepID=UPI0006ACE96E|nr:GntR family transcriptional regulator [Pseudomonas syringae]
MSATPYYQQLSELLEARIAGYKIDVGARLPSENDLCIEFGLSRATVRQALQLLETRGFATRVNGRGVYAAKPDSSHGWMIQGVEGFLENAMGHQNRSVSTQVLGHGKETLPSFACTSLDLPVDSEGYVLKRLRCLDGKPALYSINYSPPFLVAAIADAAMVLAGDASFSELTARAGYALGGANRTIRAVAAGGEVARQLQVEAGTPLLHIRSTSWTCQGTRFDLYDTWVYSDTIPLEVNVSTVAVSARP